MIRYIIIKEIADKISSNTYIILSSLIIIIFIVNGLGNLCYNDYSQKIESDYLSNFNSKFNEVKTLSDLTFHKQKIKCPPSDFQFISGGKSINLPYGAEVDYFNYPFPSNIKFNKMTFSEEVFNFDWMTILMFFVSLLTLVLSYDTICKDKIEGTLKLILSNNISKSKVFIGKYISLLILVLAPIIVGIIFNLIQIINIVKINEFIVLNIAIYLGVIYLFISVNILFGILFSSVSSNPSISLNYCLIIWLVFVFVIPQFGILYTKTRFSPPSREKVWYDSMQAGFELFYKGKYSAEWWDSWIGKEPNDILRSRVAGWHKIQEIVNNNMEDLHLKYKNQLNSALDIAQISPYYSFKNLSEVLFNNSIYRQYDFEKQIVNYQQTLKYYILNKDKKDKASYHAIWNEKSFCPHFMSNAKISYKDIPKFQYKSPSIIAKITKGRNNLFYILSLNIILFCLTFVLFSKYDVR